MQLKRQQPAVQRTQSLAPRIAAFAHGTTGVHMAPWLQAVDVLLQVQTCGYDLRRHAGSAY